MTENADRPDMERIAAYPYASASEHAVSLFLADMLGPWGPEVKFGLAQLRTTVELPLYVVRASLNALVADKAGPWEYRGIDMGRSVMALRAEFFESNPAPIDVVERFWEKTYPLPDEYVPSEELRLTAARWQARKEVKADEGIQSGRRREAVRDANPDKAESRALRAMARVAFKNDFGRYPGKTEAWKVQHWIENDQQWPTKEQIAAYKEQLAQDKARIADDHSEPRSSQLREEKRYPARQPDPANMPAPFKIEWDLEAVLASYEKTEQEPSRSDEDPFAGLN